MKEKGWETGSVPGPLVTYRRHGGMAGLDQRLTIREDGQARLEDRKSRNRSEVVANSAEIENLRSLIDSVPADEWHGLLGTVARGMFPRPHETMRFELHTARGRITGTAGIHDTRVAALLGQLDELLARAVREGRAQS